ncbi:hypothetical protein CGRA01v4_14196 [Colletotrichum graminicola]|nr:hypothetical protein CGRA01v4_14196 [Colletotrichum graminicola]
MQPAPHSLARDVRGLGWRLLRRGQGLLQDDGQMVINASRGRFQWRCYGPPG